ncbi:MAG: hypothetical protein IIY55_11455, partial [Blautia sp.]|nr:hypothetical protein [Blautia sp.]
TEVQLNGEWIDTVYVNPNTLIIAGTELGDFDTLTVCQRSNSPTRKALSRSQDRAVYALLPESRWKIPENAAPASADAREGVTAGAGGDQEGTAGGTGDVPEGTVPESADGAPEQ